MIIPNRSILLTTLPNKTYKTSRKRSLLLPRTLTHKAEIQRHLVICGTKGTVHATAAVFVGHMMELKLPTPQDFLLREKINITV